MLFAHLQNTSERFRQRKNNTRMRCSLPATLAKTKSGDLHTVKGPHLLPQGGPQGKNRVFLGHGLRPSALPSPLCSLRLPVDSRRPPPHPPSRARKGPLRPSIRPWRRGGTACASRCMSGRMQEVRVHSRAGGACGRPVRWVACVTAVVLGSGDAPEKMASQQDEETRMPPSKQTQYAQ